MAAVGCDVCNWLWRCESRPAVSLNVPNCSTPPRFGCRCAAALCGANPPRAAPTSAALVVVRNVLRLSSVVCAWLSILPPPHIGIWCAITPSLHKQPCPGTRAPMPRKCTSTVLPHASDIRRAQAATAVGQGARRARLVALQRLDRRRGQGEFMQVEERQLDVDDVPALGVQRLAPGQIQCPSGLFHQLIVMRVLPP